MSNNRSPRQPPTYGYPSQMPPSMEQYPSQSPPNAGPVMQPTKSTFQDGIYHRHGLGPDRPPKASNSTIQPVVQLPSQGRPSPGSMMPPTSHSNPYGESYRSPGAAGQNNSKHTRGPSLSTVQPVEPPFQSHAFAGPSPQPNIYSNPSSAPVQSPRQATRTNTLQSGSHLSTGSYSVSSQVTSGVQGQAASISKFDAFFKAEGQNLRHYDKLVGSAATAREEKFERALEISKLVVKGISIVSEINPIAKVVASAAEALLDLEEARQSNEKMVYVMLIQINDLLVELFDLRHITGGVNYGNPASNKLAKLLAVISDDITQCISDITSFKQTRTFVKIILVGQYEETFKKHTQQFANHRAEFYNVMAMFNLQSALRAEALSVKVLKKMDMYLEIVRTDSQTKAIEYIRRVGGIERMIVNNRNDRELLDIVGGATIDYTKLRTEYDWTSERIGRMEAVLQDIHKVFDRLDHRMPPFIGDEEIDLLIKRHFVLWDVDALNFAREFESTFPENRNDPFSWMRAFIGPDFSDQIMDAYDHNASGMINYYELLRFGESRPQGWTLLRWTTCWTVGWPMTIGAMCSSIQRGLREYDIPSNGSRPRDYILPQFDQFLQSLFQRTKNLPIIQDPTLRLYVKEFAMIPQDTVFIKMKEWGFFLASGDDVKEICDDRVEFWIFTLVETFLKGYLKNLQSGMFIENFRTTQQSIITAFANRANDISKAKRGSLESFAFGIFANDVKEPFSQPFLPSGPMQGLYGGYLPGSGNIRSQGHAKTQKAGPGEGDLLMHMNTAFNDLSLTPPPADSQRSRHTTTKTNHLPQEFKSQNFPSPDPQDIATPLYTATTQLKSFKRHINSGLWGEDVKHSLRSMIGSEVLGPASGKLLLYNKMLYKEYSHIQRISATNFGSSNTVTVVRLGDLGSVDKFGIFHPLLNIFDRVEPNQEGMPLNILALQQYRNDYDIDPLTTFQTARFKPNFSSHVSSQRNYRWSALNARNGTIVVLPDGGKVSQINVERALRDPESLERFDQLSLTWYRKALGMLGSRAYNGALMFVSAVHVAPVFYVASFYSEKSVAKAEISLKPYEDIPRLYLWNPEAGKLDMWHTCKQPSLDELERMNGAKLPLEQVCALSLTVVELGQAIWDRFFAQSLPGSQALYDLANAPDPSVKSESSSMAARAAKKVGSFFKPS